MTLSERIHEALFDLGASDIEHWERSTYGVSLCKDWRQIIADHLAEKLADTLDARPQAQEWQIVSERTDGRRVVIRSGYRCQHAANAARAEIEQYTQPDANLLIQPADPPVSDRRLPDASTPRTDEPRDLNIGAWPKPQGESGDQRGRRLDPGRGRFRG
jgi:hypothetical protein